MRGSSNDWMASSTPSIWTGWRSLRSSIDSGPRDRGRGADGRRVAGEDVVDGDGAVAAHLRRAANQERGHAELALVGLQRVGDRREGQERREQLVLDDLEGEGPGRGPIGLQRDLHRDQRRTGAERAGDGRRPILAHRADDVADGGQLLRDVQARQQGLDPGPRHRELGRAEVEERMAERVDAPAVDVGDRAGGAEGQVAADQADADRVAWRQRGGDGGAGGDRRLGRVPRRERRAERAGERRRPCRRRSRPSCRRRRSAAAAHDWGARRAPARRRRPARSARSRW